MHLLCLAKKGAVMPHAMIYTRFRFVALAYCTLLEISVHRWAKHGPRLACVCRNLGDHVCLASSARLQSVSTSPDSNGQLLLRLLPAAAAADCFQLLLQNLLLFYNLTLASFLTPPCLQCRSQMASQTSQMFASSLTLLVGQAHHGNLLCNALVRILQRLSQLTSRQSNKAH